MSKSAIYTANTTAQSVAVGGTIALGSIVRRFGCNLSLSPYGITLNGSGYYKVDASITAAPAAAGTVTVQLYKDGTAVAGAVASAEVAAADDVVSIPITALVREQACCCDRNSALTLVLSGAASSVTNVAVVVEKL